MDPVQNRPPPPPPHSQPQDLYVYTSNYKHPPKHRVLLISYNGAVVINIPILQGLLPSAGIESLAGLSH